MATTVEDGRLIITPARICSANAESGRMTEVDVKISAWLCSVHRFKIER
jgi:hypothetical protein